MPKTFDRPSFAGPALGSFGAILSVIPLVGSAVMSLLSPFALLAAAVAGGVYIWTNYRESGKKAFAGIMAALAPFIATFKTTFGGISDATMSVT